MGNLTKSAIVDFMEDYDMEFMKDTKIDDDLAAKLRAEVEEDAKNKKKDASHVHKSCDWAIYDETGDEICCVKSQKEAIATVAEFKHMDKKEKRSNKKYTIKKVS